MSDPWEVLGPCQLFTSQLHPRWHLLPLRGSQKSLLRPRVHWGQSPCLQLFQRCCPRPRWAPWSGWPSPGPHCHGASHPTGHLRHLPASLRAGGAQAAALLVPPAAVRGKPPAPGHMRSADEWLSPGQLGKVPLPICRAICSFPNHPFPTPGRMGDVGALGKGRVPEPDPEDWEGWSPGGEAADLPPELPWASTPPSRVVPRAALPERPGSSCCAVRSCGVAGHSSWADPGHRQPSSSPHRPPPGGLREPLHLPAAHLSTSKRAYVQRPCGGDMEAGPSGAHVPGERWPFLWPWVRGCHGGASSSPTPSSLHGVKTEGNGSRTHVSVQSGTGRVRL